MRSLLALLVVIGVFAGAIGRAVAHAYPHHHEVCEMSGCVSIDHDCCPPLPSENSCCDSDHQPVSHDEKDDSKVPEQHHHHHICCVSSPIVAGDETRIRFTGLDGVRTPLSVEHHSVPEGPVFELDQPPLI